MMLEVGIRRVNLKVCPAFGWPSGFGFKRTGLRSEETKWMRRVCGITTANLNRDHSLNGAGATLCEKPWLNPNKPAVTSNW